MHITKHVIERFQERITFESIEMVRFFIEQDIKKSEPLYRVNQTEKRICNGIIYVLDYKNEVMPKVITLYLAEEGENQYVY